MRLGDIYHFLHVHNQDQPEPKRLLKSWEENFPLELFCPLFLPGRIETKIEPHADIAYYLGIKTGPAQ